MCYSIENKERGFTLVELLIAMTIGLIILAALSSTFLMQRKIYDVQEQIVEMVQTARAAMDMMSREIRMAGYDPKGAGFVGIPHDGAMTLQIYADLNGNGSLTYTDENNIIRYEKHERIRYTMDSDYPFSIRRGTAGPADSQPSRQPFAENIQSFIVDYLDSAGSATTTTADIRQIKLTIKARTAKPDADYSTNGGYRTHTLTSFITPRNIGL